MPQARLSRGTVADVGSAATPTIGSETGTAYGKLRPGPGRDPREVADHQRARIDGAMVELVIARDYDAVTLRGIARLAGVSTRTFYKHYSSKEECFLAVYRAASRRLLRSLASASDGTSQEEVARGLVQTMVDAPIREPAQARILLVESQAAGPVVLKETQRARRLLEAVIRDAFAGIADEADVPPLFAEWVVGGLQATARRFVLADDTSTGEGVSREELVGWVLACLEASTGSGGFDRFSRHRMAKLAVERRASAREPASVSMAEGDISALLNAAAALVAEKGREGLSACEVVEAAGTSRKAFEASFSNLEDCLSAVSEMRIRQALARAERAGEGSITSEAGVCAALLSLCESAADDAAFANLCLSNSALSGRRRLAHRQRLADGFARLLEHRLAGLSEFTCTRAEASAAAILTTVENHVIAGKINEIRAAVPQLNRLLLASTTRARKSAGSRVASLPVHAAA